MKSDYEEKITTIEAAMTTETEELVTAEEIGKLQTELFNMKNFGTNLRSIDKKKL